MTERFLAIRTILLNDSMRNTYRIIDYREFGLPSIYVYGDNFHYQDLYKLIGKERYMTTFQLKENSASYINFGISVLGVIHYDKNSLDELENSLVSKNEISKSKIRIDCADRDRTKEEKGDLRYRGIEIADIESISFLLYSREIEKHETGEKKIPNVIEIETDLKGIDVDILTKNYLISKNNHGTNLIHYEKEQLVGIILGLNNGKIDSRTLKHFGFSEHDLQSNLNIWASLYKVKERRKQLTETERKEYAEVKTVLLLEKITTLFKELTNVELSGSLADSEKETLIRIFKSINEFSPSILMHGKNQVYWDIDSYIHIALRHLKDCQLGSYQNKTPFPYKSEDLEALIKHVLYQVKGEIEHYLIENNTSDFTRHGKMAIFYNGDHYHIRINSEGRLIQLHAV